MIRLRSPSKATIAEGKDASATGTIIDDDILPRVATDWLARFGRTAAGATLDAIARRMNDGPAASRAVAHRGRAPRGIRPGTDRPGRGRHCCAVGGRLGTRP